MFLYNIFQILDTNKNHSNICNLKEKTRFKDTISTSTTLKGAKNTTYDLKIYKIIFSKKIL